MSVNYASGLSPYGNKGVCGLPEVVDSPDEVDRKIEALAQMIKNASCVVVYCGAGISTGSGIPDFRGPNGVWTLEQKKVKKSDGSISFNDTKPNYNHYALISLLRAKRVHFIVSQNIDGLFLKAGIERKYISELHGNFFLDECSHCKSRFIRRTASTTMGLKPSSQPCPRAGRPCRGVLRDTILDWEDELPTAELKRANKFSQKADLAICLGTSLQIVPAASMPFLCKKRKENPGQVAIVNLQSTKLDSKADLVIHDYIENVLTKICKSLSVQVKLWGDEFDVTKTCDNFTIWKA